ncbi:MAG TPA: 3-phosphoserine/phosphohydroxythreonine transaminase [Thermoanaerobaculia bacterium]|nr:3-phosphoserine/phosphohydroxythreonine transaminase [Thermoanaerobaculia bacterium]
MSERVYNFNAGPANLPLPVLEEVQRNLLALPGVGMSILEISHRSSTFLGMMEEAEANLRTLLGIPEGYHVLFLPGGASLQFAMVPLSFLPAGSSADYVVTGSWSDKAAKEADRLAKGTARRAWSGKAGGYVRVPAAGEVEADPGAAYLHFTSNETIHGVCFGDARPATSVPLICDVSSDFLSRPIDVSRYAMLYAGAQKNLGPAGVTVVILRDDLLSRIPEHLPTMLDYRVHVADKSNYNTPPVFAIYVVLLVTRWLLGEVGGLAAMLERNQEKAQLVYDAIDRSGGYYRAHAEPASRSLMNITFRLGDEEAEKRFLATAQKQGFAGLKGHRSVGGIRASVYNAMPLDGAKALANFMDAFRSGD